MNGAFYVGAIGLEAQQRALDTIANNISNMNTPAFKRSEVRFSELIASRSDPNVATAALGTASIASAGVTARPIAMLNLGGPIEQTGNALDLAIEGAGFIEVMGPGGQVLLWRGGTLTVGEDGLLATERGFALKAAISVPMDSASISIAADGTILANASSGDQSEIGQLTLVKVDDPAVLERVDGGLYRAGDAAQLLEARPGEDGMGTIVQGALERSNVELTVEMVQMMLVQRAYAANAQVLQAADQMMAIANGLRR